MRIDETGQYDLPTAIDFQNTLPVLFEPRIVERFLCGSDGDDLATGTKHCSIFDYGEFLEIAAATGASLR
jgi:hypothetical protein